MIGSAGVESHLASRYDIRVAGLIELAIPRQSESAPPAGFEPAHPPPRPGVRPIKAFTRQHWSLGSGLRLLCLRLWPLFRSTNRSRDDGPCGRRTITLRIRERSTSRSLGQCGTGIAASVFGRS
jgi:hypothetical protein